jgi:hypothetical protein
MVWIIDNPNGSGQSIGNRSALERTSHLLRVQKTPLPHHVLEKSELAFVDEQHELARLGEVCLRGK